MDDTQHARAYSRGWLLLLTLLTAFSSLSTDMYLPALPIIAQEYGVTTQHVANTLAAYFLGLACGQLFYGPLSDRFGRKPPLYFGLALYIVASLCCALAPNETVLLICRVFQALGGCAGVVIARAAIRDRLDIRESAQVFSSMLLVMGLAPVLAPAFGVLLIQYFHWSSIFYLLTLIGVLTLILVHLYFQETLPVDKRHVVPFKRILYSYLKLFQSPTFSLPMLAGACSYGIIYCYLSASSNLFIDFLGLSKQTFVYLFAINAFSLIVFSSMNKRLIRSFTVYQLFKGGCFIQLSGIVMINLCAWLNFPNLYVIMLGLFLLIGGIGITGPNSIAIVLHSQSSQAGLASALMGCVQFLTGFVMGIILFFLPFNILQNISLTTLIAITISLFLAYQNIQDRAAYPTLSR
ncbi:multidrug effflux MFS transporter [Acinetobacter indicus]|uniref:multidrug effflux MFS transporter n=1 Tax=Acinetobacter indicus TaxID=756892 RepID=UPI001443BE31|nr:multidrug effflux MFS transporter [Acinetobacter indicus]MDM1285752.1 multidrug effflux MFS transporter [Acinetobacter indicus]